MKILHVITSLMTGGAERLIVDLLPRFAQKGVVVELAVFNATPTPFMRVLVEKGIRIHRFYPDGCNVYSPGNLFKLIALLRREKYDIVHTHNTAPQIFAAIASLFVDCKFITTEHNTSNRRRDKRWLYPLDKWMYSRYAEVISISEDAKISLNSYLKTSEFPCVIPNGIDYKSFYNPVKDIRQNTDFEMVMVARFAEQKDQDTIICALQLLPKNFRLRLVGDGVRRATLQALAQSRCVADRVEFAGVQSDVPGVLRRADIVVMSSVYEGLSLSSLEGMASGRPFVASDVPGLREVARDAGILFPQGDAQALAKIIIDLASKPALYAATATACQKRAEQYDISKTVEGYMNVYKKVTT